MFLTEKAKEMIRDQVSIGSNYLDTVVPDWFRHINAQSLNLSSDCDCVLGQLRNLDIDVGFTDYPSSRGFDYDPHYLTHIYPDADSGRYVLIEEWYKLLDELWIAEIKNRFVDAIV